MTKRTLWNVVVCLTVGDVVEVWVAEEDMVGQVEVGMMNHAVVVGVGGGKTIIVGVVGTITVTGHHIGIAATGIIVTEAATIKEAVVTVIVIVIDIVAVAVEMSEVGVEMMTTGREIVVIIDVTTIATAIVTVEAAEEKIVAIATVIVEITTVGRVGMAVAVGVAVMEEETIGRIDGSCNACANNNQRQSSIL